MISSDPILLQDPILLHEQGAIQPGARAGRDAARRDAVSKPRHKRAFRAASDRDTRGGCGAAQWREYWWVLALRGALAILFALLAFFLPLVAATAMVLVFGAYAFVDGIFALIAGLRAARRHGRSAPLLIEGVLNLLIGVAVFVWPAAMLVALIYLIVIWAVLTG